LLFEINNQCALNAKMTFQKYLKDVENIYTSETQVMDTSANTQDHEYLYKYCKSINKYLEDLNTLTVYNRFLNIFTKLYTDKIHWNYKLITRIHLLYNDVETKIINCNGFSLNDIAYKVQLLCNMTINDPKDKQKNIKMNMNYVTNDGLLVNIKLEQ
jgi:hypothetical protein